MTGPDGAAMVAPYPPNGNETNAGRTACGKTANPISGFQIRLACANG
jgi:hypothetical protein